MDDSQPAVDVQSLDASYGRQPVLRDLSISIDRGRVTGLLGLNGAGKTTLLRHLLGLQRPGGGRVRVLGGDPIGDRTEVLARVGYLSEEDSLPQWMSVAELLRFCAAIQPRWDAAEAERLRDWFDLDPAAPLRSLSKGTRARAGLIAAIAHRPDLLILDEPSSGLDPIARDEVLRAIIETLQNDGRTVLLSSHQLDEVERLCDDVAVLHNGRIDSVVTIDSLPRRMAVWTMPGGYPAETDAGKSPPWLLRRRPGPGEDQWLVDLTTLDSDEATRWKADVLETRPATLKDHFEQIVGRRRASEAAAS